MLILVLFNLSLEVIKGTRFNILILPEFTSTTTLNTLRLELLYNFINTGVKGELRNFTLPIKKGVLQQEFLFVDKT